jgi:NitT/TauT family transport system substrate-binding protein
MTMHRRTLLAAALPAVLAATIRPARAAEKFSLAVGQKGNWDTSVCEMGVRSGIFAKHDIAADILYTQGSGETLQAVLSRSADLGVAGGTLGAMGAYAKGAPLRIIANGTTGAGDLFWYVPADSPIKSIKDCDGKTVAFSTQGSSTNSVVLGFGPTFGIAPKLVSTGGIPGTYTQVMSGQVDVGWSAVPYNLDAAEQGKIRIIARGNDVPELRTQTIRVNVAHLNVLTDRKSALQTFTRAYRETIDWMYASDDAVKAYGDFASVPAPTVRRLRTEFFPKASIWPDTVSGLDSVMADGIRFKYLQAPLTAQQLSDLIQIPAA